MPYVKANRYAKGRYIKVSGDDNWSGASKGKRAGFDLNGEVECESCFKLRNELQEVKAELRRVRDALKCATKTTKKDVENAHTPSSARRFKKKATPENVSRKGGAKAGHKGNGRTAVDEESADQVIHLTPLTACPHCNHQLQNRGFVDRTVVDVENTRAQRVLYKSVKQCCQKCKKTISVKPPVLPKSLYGNNLLAHAVTQHYMHGVPLGRLMQMYGTELNLGGVINAFHRLGRIFGSAVPNLIEDFRSSKVRHADETGWRADGQSGYAWIFATPLITIFDFADNRSSRVPARILGEKKLEGVLVVDRYGGYNKMKVNLQYCFAHLMREVQKLGEEFTDSREVEKFCSELIPSMALAMKLRTQDLTDVEFYKQAAEVEKSIKALILKTFNHLGIKRIQEIFREKEHRLYHWAKDRDVPADNNRAERELRPTVIARKVSFGSQSIQGAKTRQSIMSVLSTVRKRLPENTSIEAWLKSALDKISINSSIQIYDLIPHAPANN